MYKEEDSSSGNGFGGFMTRNHCSGSAKAKTVFEKSALRPKRYTRGSIDKCIVECLRGQVRPFLI